MANEVANAVQLINDKPFRDWVMVVGCYQSRIVIQNGQDEAARSDHATRLDLANRFLENPNPFLDSLIRLLATDPEICSLGVTVGSNAVTQEVLITKIAAIWSSFAAAKLT